VFQELSIPGSNVQDFVFVIIAGVYRDGFEWLSGLFYFVCLTPSPAGVRIPAAPNTSFHSL
jgi:hypothetical protein